MNDSDGLRPPPGADLFAAPTPPRSRLRRRHLKDDVASHVRDLVFSAVLRPGMRVDQDAVAAATGTSRLPVREALIVLEAEGVVVNHPRRGFFVADLTPDDVHDTYRVVGEVSVIAVARAVELATPAMVAQLAELVEVMRMGGDGEAEEAHHEFHRTINLAGGSRRLRAMLRTLSHALPEQVHFASRGDTREALLEHVDLLDAVEARDDERAVRATRAHFADGAEDAVRMLAARGFWDDGQPSATGPFGDVVDSS